MPHTERSWRGRIRNWLVRPRVEVPDISHANETADRAQAERQFREYIISQAGRFLQKFQKEEAYVHQIALPLDEFISDIQNALSQEMLFNRIGQVEAIPMSRPSYCTDTYQLTVGEYIYQMWIEFETDGNPSLKFVKLDD